MRLDSTRLGTLKATRRCRFPRARLLLDDVELGAPISRPPRSSGVRGQWPALPVTDGLESGGLDAILDQLRHHRIGAHLGEVDVGGIRPHRVGVALDAQLADSHVVTQRLCDLLEDLKALLAGDPRTAGLEPDL